MPDTYKFTGKDGAERTFVGDRPPTDAEMASLEKGEAPKSAPHMSAALPQTALPADYSPFTDKSQLERVVSPETWKKLNDPLIKATGVNAIDSLTSPLNVGVALLTGGRPAAQAAFKGLSSLVSSAEPEVAREIVGLVSPRAGHALRLVQKLAGAAKSEAPAAAAEAAPVAEAVAAKPTVAAMLSDLDVARQEYIAGRLTKNQFEEIERFVSRKTVPSGTGTAMTPGSMPRQAPPPAASITTPQTTTSSAVLGRRAPSAPPTAASVVAPPSAPAPVPAAPSAAAPIAAPAAAVPAVTQPQAAPAPTAPAPTAPPFYEQKALNELAIMARRAKVTLSPADYDAGLDLMRKGARADETVAALVQQKTAPPVDPAAAFNERFGLKTPTEAQTKFPKGMRGKPAGSD